MTTEEPGGAVLTDDEVLGLAAVVGARWRVITPTVDARNDVDLTAATVRGIRSLTIRGLLLAGDDGPRVHPSLDDVVATTLRGPLLTSTFACSAGLEFDPDGLTMVAFGVVGDLDLSVVDVVSAEGVHAFGRGTYADARTVLDEAVAASTDRSADSGAAYCVVLDGGLGPRRIYRFLGMEISGAALAAVQDAESPDAGLATVSRLSFDTAVTGVFTRGDGAERDR